MREMRAGEQRDPIQLSGSARCRESTPALGKLSPWLTALTTSSSLSSSSFWIVLYFVCWTEEPMFPVLLFADWDQDTP